MTLPAFIINTRISHNINDRKRMTFRDILSKLVCLFLELNNIKKVSDSFIEQGPILYLFNQRNQRIFADLGKALNVPMTNPPIEQTIAIINPNENTHSISTRFVFPRTVTVTTV